ncbi:hypothetical protein HK096_009624, partial [Nowakowskiella sp. JEL0078]
MNVSTVKTRTDLQKIKIVRGDFNEKVLSETVNVPERNASVVHAWMKATLDEEDCRSENEIYLKLLEVYEWKKSADSSTPLPEPEKLKPVRDNFKRKSTLIFAASVQHIKDLVDAFRFCGIDSIDCVFGDMNFTDRTNVMKRFSNSELRILVNCGIVTEGVDIPNIDCVVLARPTASPVLFQQMIGRGLRLHTNKENCLLLDFHDVVGNKASLATAPTLFGLNPMFTYNGDIQKLGEIAKHVEESNLSPAILNMDDLDELMKFLEKPHKPVVNCNPELDNILKVTITGERALFEDKDVPITIKFSNPFCALNYLSLKSDEKDLQKITKYHW